MGRILEEICLFQGALRDKDVPLYVRILLFLLIAYLVSPVDLIPDFIPVVGMLDEVLLLPLAFVLIKRLIPDDVLARLRNRARPEKPGNGLIASGAVLIVMIWILLVLVCMWLFTGLTSRSPSI